MTEMHTAGIWDPILDNYPLTIYCRWHRRRRRSLRPRQVVISDCHRIKPSTPHETTQLDFLLLTVYYKNITI